MRIVLIAEPPSGDKVAAELRSRGLSVDYRRSVSDHAMVAAAGIGADWCLVMNGNSLGAALKERARKAGSRYVAIPSGWSQTARALREAGFPAEILEPQCITLKLSEPEARPVPALLAPAAEVVEAAPPAPEPTVDEKILQVARAAFESDPEVAGETVISNLRRAGIIINNPTASGIYAVRREVRASVGLKPSGRGRPTSQEPREAREASGQLALPPPTTGLPAEVRTAAELLAQALRGASLAGWVRVTDRGEVEFDGEVRQRLAGKLQVEV